ncbi:MAG: hypothetical protein ACLQDL_18465 [Spirochaetia bacterium]
MKLSQRLVGWSLVALGAVSLFVGASPIFPVGIEAFVLGGALFAAGAWILAGKDLRDTIRRGIRAWRATQHEGSVRRVDRRPDGPAALLDPLLPVRILKLARQEHGTLTVADVAMELNVPLEQAQAGLDACVRAGNALPDYDMTRGLSVYRFPEFADPDPHRLPG